MEVLANFGLGAAYNPEPTAIEEDSAKAKAISCIPIFGILESWIQQHSLGNQIGRTQDAPRLVELIDVKNHYKAADVIRCLLTTALVIAGIAFGIFSSFLLTIWAGYNVLAAGTIASEIYHNQQMINELKSTGFRDGMEVY